MMDGRDGWMNDGWGVKDEWVCGLNGWVSGWMGWVGW